MKTTSRGAEEDDDEEGAPIAGKPSPAKISPARTESPMIQAQVDFFRSSPELGRAELVGG